MKDICIISTDFHANTNAYWRKKTLESVQQMKDSDYFNHDASHIDGQENIIDFRDLKECTIKKLIYLNYLSIVEEAQEET